MLLMLLPLQATLDALMSPSPGEERHWRSSGAELATVYKVGSIEELHPPNSDCPGASRCIRAAYCPRAMYRIVPTHMVSQCAPLVYCHPACHSTSRRCTASPPRTAAWSS